MHSEIQPSEDLSILSLFLHYCRIFLFQKFPFFFNFQVHLALNVTLQALDKKLSGKFHMKENDIRRFINLYKCGDPIDTNRLGTLFRDLVETDVENELSKIDEYLSKELMLKRNMLMANTIESKLKDETYDNARMFFAVGAGNFFFLRFVKYTAFHFTTFVRRPNRPFVFFPVREKIESSSNHYLKELPYFTFNVFLRSPTWKSIHSHSSPRKRLHCSSYTTR